MSKEAMKLALEALENLIKKTSGQAIYSFMETERGDAMAACVGLRKALAEQPAQQEPVAWMASDDSSAIENSPPHHDVIHQWIPLYTTPQAQPAREWVGLTPEECVEIAARGYPRWFEFANAVEAKLKEKNT